METNSFYPEEYAIVIYFKDSFLVSAECSRHFSNAQEVRDEARRILTDVYPLSSESIVIYNVYTGELVAEIKRDE